MTEEKEYVDLKWIARRYGYSDWRSVRRLAQHGNLPGAFKIPPDKPNSRWRVDKETLFAAWGK